MPTEWKGGNNQGGISQYSGVVLERPECAAMIGAIVAEWSFAESMLAFMYGTLVAPMARVSVPQGSSGWIAMETFDMVSNLKHRRSMLLAALERRHFDKPTIDEFKRLFKKLQEAGDLRIVSAHGRWGVDKAYPNALIHQRGVATMPKATVYELDDFIAARIRIMETSAALNAFFDASIRPKLEKDQAALLEAIRTTEPFHEEPTS